MLNDAPGLSDQDQTRLAVAALAASFAKTLEKNGAMVPADFLDTLDKMRQIMRDAEAPSLHALETLQWTSELYRELRK